MSKNTHPMQNFRRINALKQLETELESKEKTNKKSFLKIPLTSGDTKRIKEEIQTLKSRINLN